MAVLSGHRAGSAVSFKKTYEPKGYGYETVDYAGDVNSDATEIAGRWTVDRYLSGEFLMIRNAGKAEAEARKSEAVA